MMLTKGLLFSISFACYFINVLGLDLSRFYTECPCLRSFGDPVNSYSTKNLDSCYVTCLANRQCVGFSHSSVTKECHLYNISAIGYVAAAGRAMNCSGFPSERSTSTLKWYWPHEDEGGSTFDCQLLKDNDPIVENGYYGIRIRGRLVQVYCRMEVSPAETYMDINAYSTWGGSIWSTCGPPPCPYGRETRTYQKVLIKFDECMLAIDRRNYHYATGSTFAYHAMFVGSGGDCKSSFSSSTGEHEMNLTNTPFQFMGGLIFDYNGWGGHHHARTSTPKYSFLTGSGGCGVGEARNMDDIDAYPYFGDFIPLQLESLV